MGTLQVVSHTMSANHSSHFDEGLPFNNAFLTKNAQDVRVVILALNVLKVSPHL